MKDWATATEGAFLMIESSDQAQYFLNYHPKST